MKEWKKVSCYWQGVVYARGDERKVVIPDCPVFYFNLDTKKVWWHRNTSRNKATGPNKDK